MSRHSQLQVYPAILMTAHRSKKRGESVYMENLHIKHRLPLTVHDVHLVAQGGRILFKDTPLLSRIIIVYSLLVLIIVHLQCPAQTVQNACGEVLYVIPDNVSKETARTTAIERARIDALIGVFGQTVSEINVVSMSNEPRNNTDGFRSYSELEVKGEWLADNTEPEISFFMDENGNMTVKAKVCGKVRKKQLSQAELFTQVLRNHTDNPTENTSFVSDKDKMFLRFRSSDDGYLCIFLLDDSRNVVRLFPYQSDPERKMRVLKGKTYIFFSLNDKEDPFMPATERLSQTFCVLFTEKTVEYDKLYIIFSKNEISLPMEDEDYREGKEHDFLNEALTFSQFEKWLMHSRIKDPSMQMILKDIEILSK